MRPPVNLDELADGVRRRDRALLGRAITLVESSRPDHRDTARRLLERLRPEAGDALRIGISGVPGAGKSTFIEALGCRLIDRGHRLAVLAVDPSSAVSGGSVLGDKTRMEELARRPEAFIRPSPAAGTLGGVSRATREAMLVCEAAGFDVVLVETVGVGQSELLVSEMVDLFLVLVLAGAGDELQGIKRGILELADVLAVNKADGDNRERALRARAELERALAILRPVPAEDEPRVMTCSARTGEGLDELWDRLESGYRRMAADGRLASRRREQLVRWMWALVDDRLRDEIRRHPEVRRLRQDLEAAVRDGRRGAADAADELLTAFGIC